MDWRDASAWALMPELFRRVENFNLRYDTDSKPGRLNEALRRSFIESMPGMIGMLLLTDKAVIGHLVVTLEDWMGTKMATIIQLESDEPITPEMMDVPYEFLHHWAAGNGCAFLQCMARSEVVARLFRQKYGFDQKRILMRKAIAVVQGESNPQMAVATAENDKRGSA